MLSEANADRLANALCRMRGAALKLGALVIVSLGLFQCIISITRHLLTGIVTC